MSDLAEIATICALEQGITIVAVVDAKATGIASSASQSCRRSMPCPGGFDALVVTDLASTRETMKAALTALEAERVFRAGVASAWVSDRANGERRMTAELHPRWFVAHTHPHAEAKATAHLNRQGFEIYFPRYLKRRRHARRIETVAAPLFPRYLFVAIDLNIHRWRSICSTVGVSRLVSNGDDPTPVPMGIVEALRNREDAGGFIKVGLPPAISCRRQGSRA